MEALSVVAIVFNEIGIKVPPKSLPTKWNIFTVNVDKVTMLWH